MPFDLEHLADLLNGRYAAVFGAEHTTTALLPDDLARYELSGKPGGSVNLNAEGLPWLGAKAPQGGKGWSPWKSPTTTPCRRCPVA